MSSTNTKATNHCGRLEPLRMRATSRSKISQRRQVQFNSKLRKNLRGVPLFQASRGQLSDRILTCQSLRAREDRMSAIGRKD